MHRSFIKWFENASDLLSGKGLLIVKVMCILSYFKVMKKTIILVGKLLQMLCKAFLLVSERMLGDHLEDGVFSDMTSEVLDSETVNLPKTNACSERDLTLLDR